MNSGSALVRNICHGVSTRADRGPRAGSPRGVVDATELTLAGGDATNDRFRTRLRYYPVLPFLVLISSQTKTLRNSQRKIGHSTAQAYNDATFPDDENL